jgi:transposase
LWGNNAGKSCVWFGFCCYINHLKLSPHIGYKALYEQAQIDIIHRDKMITLLQQNNTASAKQQERLGVIVAEQNRIIFQKDEQINDYKTLNELLQKTVTGQNEKLEQLQEIIGSQNHLIKTQVQELLQNSKQLSKLAMVKHELKLLKKMVFGRKSEKHYCSTDIPELPKAGEQLTLEMEVETVATCSITDVKKIAEHLRVTKKVTDKVPHPGRHDFPPDLREEITTIDVTDKPVGATLLRFEEQRQLACTPMEFFVKITRRPVYMAPALVPGTFKQLIAPFPPHPIQKCKADISVLTMLIIDKFLYHLPVYRLQQRFKQYGIDLKYSTLCNWLNRLADILEPLYQLLLRELLISGYLQMDETTYRVLDNEKTKGKKSHIGYLWACSNPIQRIVAFNYQRGRGKKHVHHLLSGYKGHLQTDGYCVYIKYGRTPGIIHSQCLSHARRYFWEARSNDLKRSDYVLDNFFKPLYSIEEECRTQDLSYDQIGEKRQLESVPVLDNFYQWLQLELPKVIPGSPIQRAIAYSLSRFKELRVYTTDGMLQIDNNFMERLIRPIKLGVKNYLFAGSHRGGQRAAIIYSLLGTCKLQGIDPYTWLEDVLHRISVQPEENLVKLLPQMWKPLTGKNAESQTG